MSTSVMEKRLMDMALACAVLSVFCQLPFAAAWVMSSGTGEGPGQQEQGRYEYRRSYDVVKTEGGSFTMFSPSFKELSRQGARVAAAELTLEEDGFLLPVYSSSSTLVYALEGSTHVGLMTPWGEAATIKRIRKGDIYVIPRGWVAWACNHHEQGEGHQAGRFRALIVSERTPAQGSESRPETECFHLAGRREGEGEREGCHGCGSILHGFSRDVLAQVWDVDEADVEKLLNSQRGRAIVKVPKERGSILWTEMKKRLSLMVNEFESNMMDAESDMMDADEGGSQYRRGVESTTTAFLGEFTHSLESVSPIFSNNGGELRHINRNTLPTLGKFGSSFAASCVRLKQGALLAPAWSPNAHTIAYVTKGSGRLQIANPDGSNALDTRLRPGSLVVIPRFYPSVKMASNEEELEMVAVFTSSLPVWATLAGHTSIYQNMPEAVVREAFNIPEELFQKFRQRRVTHSVILPAPEKKRQPRA